MTYLTISTWNGKEHCAKVFDAPRRNLSPSLGIEMERISLTEREATLSLAALTSLRSFGVLADTDRHTNTGVRG